MSTVCSTGKWHEQVSRSVESFRDGNSGGYLWLPLLRMKEARMYFSERAVLIRVCLCGTCKSEKEISYVFPSSKSNRALVISLILVDSLLNGVTDLNLVTSSSEHSFCNRDQLFLALLLQLSVLSALPTLFVPMRVLASKARCAIPCLVGVRRTVQSFEDPKRSAGTFPASQIARETNRLGRIIGEVAIETIPLR